MSKFLPLCIATVLLTACAGTGAEYRPVVDRPGPNFETDLAQCQHLATQRDYVNGDSMTDTAVGAGIGGVVGILSNSWTGAAVGAAVGGAGGATVGGLEAKDDRKTIVVKCMQGRGYNVLK